LFSQLLAVGVSRGAVALAIPTSAEGYQNTIKSNSQQYLRRAADDGGLAYFVAPLEKGVSDDLVVAALAASDEYFAWL
jgi:hypothetical protein